MIVALGLYPDITRINTDNFRNRFRDQRADLEFMRYINKRLYNYYLMTIEEYCFDENNKSSTFVEWAKQENLIPMSYEKDDESLIDLMRQTAEIIYSASYHIPNFMQQRIICGLLNIMLEDYHTFGPMKELLPSKQTINIVRNAAINEDEVYDNGDSAVKQLINPEEYEEILFQDIDLTEDSLTDSRFESLGIKARTNRQQEIEDIITKTLSHNAETEIVSGQNFFVKFVTALTEKAMENFNTPFTVEERKTNFNQQKMRAKLLPDSQLFYIYTDVINKKTSKKDIDNWVNGAGCTEITENWKLE